MLKQSGFVSHLALKGKHSFLKEQTRAKIWQNLVRADKNLQETFWVPETPNSSVVCKEQLTYNSIALYFEVIWLSSFCRIYHAVIIIKKVDSASTPTYLRNKASKTDPNHRDVACRPGVVTGILRGRLSRATVSLSRARHRLSHYFLTTTTPSHSEFPVGSTHQIISNWKKSNQDSGNYETKLRISSYLKWTVEENPTTCYAKMIAKKK